MMLQKCNLFRKVWHFNHLFYLSLTDFTNSIFSGILYVEIRAVGSKYILVRQIFAREKLRKGVKGYLYYFLRSFLSETVFTAF